MKHSISVWINIGKAKHTPTSTVTVLFEALCTLDLKPRGNAKWSNCAQIHALSTKNWHKSMNCPECAQLSLVYCSVHETCAAWILLHYSVPFGSPYIAGSKKTGHPKQDILSVLSVLVFRTRPTKTSTCVSQLYPKLRIMHKNEHCCAWSTVVLP